MAAEQQLERSVLERKEREELRAIAQAMALDTNSRSKKADIIDQILRAAGVGSSADGSANGAGPARSRARRSTATASGAPASDGPVSGDGASDARVSDDPASDARVSDDPASDARVSDARVSGDGVSDVTADADAPGSGNGTGPGHDAATSAPAGEAPAATERAPSAPTDRPGGPGHQRQPGQGQGGQNRPPAAGGAANEPGNRRSRRRRGRERVPTGSGGGAGERELQGGGQEAQYSGEVVPVRGLLDLRDEGYGFLRAEGYLPSSRDVYVSISQARRFALRKGDYVEGACRPAASNEKFPALIRIDTVCELALDEARGRPRFEDLTPLFPDSKLRLETSGTAEVTTRIIDLMSPIGKGQRGLIVSPPKAGKTTILKQIAHSIEANNPEVHLIVLLVDERPEEVTDMRRSVKGEVVASTFDRPSDEHTSIAELTIERAKRLVELGRDVVIVLDGITRLARAYNLAQPASGRIMSGGVDSGALYPPKKFFGAARNIEEGGSLTILATALVET
ncbi:MAG: transcription termination factor Rho, partial [Acidimicrobiales bacterium]